MNHDFSIVELMLNASWVVQAVVALLITVSVISWAAIFRKVFALKRVKRLTDEFERDFWSGANLNDLYLAATRNARDGSPMERIFASGMREFHKLRERASPSPMPCSTARARHARKLPARVGRAGGEPVLPGFGRLGVALRGLFGTVWGIMHAFTGLAALTQVITDCP